MPCGGVPRAARDSLGHSGPTPLGSHYRRPANAGAVASLRGPAADYGQGQNRRYGLPGRNSFHSVRVRLRPATRQAAASQAGNVMGTTHV